MKSFNISKQLDIDNIISALFHNKRLGLLFVQSIGIPFLLFCFEIYCMENKGENGGPGTQNSLPEILIKSRTQNV